MSQTKPPAALAAEDQYNAELRDQVCAALSAITPSGDQQVLKRMITDHMIAQLAGRGDQCKHLTSSPGPVFAAAWLPGAMSCALCYRAVLHCPPAEEHVCDGCGETKFRKLTIGSIRMGPLIISFGLCRACQVANKVVAA